MFPSDWETRSLDVRHHPHFSKQCLLASWELKLAERINKPYLFKQCECHIEQRLQFKYFLIGIQFILLLCTTTYHPDIMIQILRFVNFTQLAQVAMYLPTHARIYIANTKNLIRNHARNYNSNLNIPRLIYCLTQRNARLLYSELETLEPFAFTQQLHTLHFTDKPLKDASFNSKRPIIACVTRDNLFYVYNYKTSNVLLCHKSISDIHKVSWNNKGNVVYIIFGHSDQLSICIFYLLPSSKMAQLTSLPINASMLSSKLWFSDYTIIYREPEASLAHLCGIYVGLNGQWQKRALLITSIDKHPLEFECLLQFKLLDHPTHINEFPNYIFFRSSCPYTNPHDNHHCLVILDLISKSIVQIFHAPGHIYNMTCNNSMLVFCFKSQREIDEYYTGDIVRGLDVTQECHMPLNTTSIDKLTLAILNPQEANIQFRQINNG